MALIFSLTSALVATMKTAAFSAIVLSLDLRAMGVFKIGKVLH